MVYWWCGMYLDVMNLNFLIQIDNLQGRASIKSLGKFFTAFAMWNREIRALGLVDHVEVFHLVLLVQKQIVLGSQLRHRRRHACCWNGSTWAHNHNSWIYGHDYQYTYIHAYIHNQLLIFTNGQSAPTLSFYLLVISFLTTKVIICTHT